MSKIDEHIGMLLAAISTASIQNTRKSAKERIGRDNPYWTQAYGDVCDAIDREMALREQVSAIEGKLRRFAAKCRPSVAHYMRTQERAAMSSALSPGAKEAAEKEAAWLGRLLNEIDELAPSLPQDLGASTAGSSHG